MPYQEPEPPVQEEKPPAVTSTGRPVRAKRLTWKLLQQLPPPPIEFEEPPPSEPDVEPPELPASEYSWQSIKTVQNSFGMFRDYPSRPTHDPDQTISLTDQSNVPAPPPATLSSAAENSRLSPLTVPVESTLGALPSFGPF
ncbi:hypothetical protein B0H19DRAFT_1070135 [Mycena capillaripes]|nr:hypothetical protein B0H19DRAFT_1070135 [Mycena capillaripes]